MSGGEDAYAIYLSEIRRFVEAEKEIPETSESEVSEESDSSSDQICGNRKPRRILDSDSSDDYFTAKERNARLNRIEDSSDTEEDQPPQSSKEPVHKIVASTPLHPAIKRKRPFKRRSSTKREESWRVDENIQKAKEKFLQKAKECHFAKGEWRRKNTFGISIEPRGGPISKSNTLPPKHDKVEVEDVIREAVGEPHGSAAKASTSTTRNVCQYRPDRGSTSGTTKVPSSSSRNDRRSVDSDRQATGARDRDRSWDRSRDPSRDRNADRDRDVVRDSCYSPPPSSRWSSSPASDSRPSILSLSNRGPNHPSSHASSSASSATGFRDTSTVPKSPWAKGHVAPKKDSL